MKNAFQHQLGKDKAKVLVEKLVCIQLLSI
ncbi:MAG: hypothetical protein K0R36_914 [Chryseobacterium sp.]|jgi:hypothetical protein|nr:hypothetical protein [Chryseobacterium sp.]